MKKWLFSTVLIIIGVTFGVTSTLAIQSYVSDSESDDRSVKEQRSSLSPLQKIFSDDFFTSDPFEDMRKIKEQMFKEFSVPDESTFGSFGNSFGDAFKELGKKNNNISIHSKEDDKFLVYEVVGSGIDTKSINIDVSGGIVTVTGRVDQESSTDKGGSTSSYIMSSSFKQSFSVPSHVDSDKVQMEHADGKIVIKFPKHRATI